MQLAARRISLNRRILAAICAFIVLPLISSPCAVAQEQPEEGGHELTAEPLDAPKAQRKAEVSNPQDALTIGNDYVIGPEDVLRVDVFDIPELSKLVLRVANDGTIALPLLGHVPVAGLTPSQVRRKLESEWGKKYLQDPQVSVFVQEFHSQPVSVVGAVEKPGLYPLTGPRTLIEMISEAGGIAKRSSATAGRTVYVTRRGGFSGLQLVDGMKLISGDKMEIDLPGLLYSKEDALNIEVQPRDIISVSKADVVYVAGNGVTKPGGLLLENQASVTVIQAIAMAQGLSPNAAKHTARIIRQTPDGARLEIPVDLSKVFKGKVPDPELSANDILFVPDNSQKAALKRAMDSTIATISGMLIFGRL